MTVTGNTTLILSIVDTAIMGPSEVTQSDPTEESIEAPNITEKIIQDLDVLEKEEVEQILNTEEKNFLLQVERGDVASVQQ